MIFILPVFSIAAGGRAAWMVVLMAGVVGWLPALLAADLARRYPGQPLAQYAFRLLGRGPGRLFLAVFALALAVSMAVDLAASVHTVLGVFLQHTPLWVIIALGVLVAVMAARSGIVRLAHGAPFFFALVALSSLVLVWSLKTEIDFGYLLPWWQPAEVRWGSLAFWAALSSCRVYSVLPAAVAHLAAPQRAIRLVSVGYWLGWLFLVPVVLLPVLMFGPEGAQTLTNPLLALLGTIHLPNVPIFDSPELLIRPVGNLSALLTVGATLIAATEAGRAVIGDRRGGLVTLLLLLAAGGVALLLLQQANVWSAMQWPLIGIALVLLPVFLFMWTRALWWPRRTGRD